MSKIPLEKLLEAHLFNIRESLSDIKQDNKNINKKFSNFQKVLYRNTITVEEHEKRSTLLEKSQDNQLDVIKEISNTLADINRRVDEIERDIAPVKEHVESVGRLMSLFIAIEKNKKTITRILALLITVFISLYLYLTENPLFKLVL